MSKLTIRGSGGCLFFTLAVGLASGCSSSNRSAPESPASARAQQSVEENDDFLQPASASLASTRRGTSPKHLALESPVDSPSAARTDTQMTQRLGEPGCAMHAESTPSGIAVIFTAQSTTPDRVAAQVQSLAAELERERRAVRTEVEPSTFGTRQIAELAAQTFVTQTPNGARLTIDAKDSERVEALRARVLWNMSRFMPDSRDARGECPVVPRIAAEQRERGVEGPTSESESSGSESSESEPSGSDQRREQ